MLLQLNNVLIFVISSIKSIIVESLIPLVKYWHYT